MSSEAVTVHIFRHAGFAPAGDTLVTVAPVACAMTAYGAAGLADAFGGSALFENRNSGAKWVGVWGARNGSRFRRRLRQLFTLSVEKSAPDARLALYTTRRGNRPDYRAWATDHPRQTIG